MKKYLDNLAPEIKKLIELCSKTAEEEGFKAYLVGGFVRDLILGVPNLDLDIVVEGDGIKFAEELALRFKAGLVRHRRFGTATVTLGPNSKIDPSTSLRVDGERSRTIDIASAREECYPEPACLPSVKSGTVKDDLKRRDFSINAMAISLNQEDYGGLIDFFNGLDDLRYKKIRILHALSFIDDPTRILRAIRFEKRYNFRLEATTLKHLKEAVKLKMLEHVEPQRLRDELILVLKEEWPIKPIKRIQQLAGFSFIHPRLILAKNNFQLLQSARKQALWFKKAHPQRRTLEAWLIYLMALFEALKIKDIKAVLETFVFSKGEEKRIITCKKISKNFIHKLSKKEIKPSIIFHSLDSLSYEAILLLKAKYKNKHFNKHIEDFLKIYNSLRLSVTGHDLAKLGFKPGPQYQKIFLKLFNASLDGRIHNKEEELGFIKIKPKV